MITPTYVNIVGLISNDEEILDIENVATVFIIEERMLDLTCNLKAKRVVKERLKILNNPILKNTSFVRGFN